MGKVASKLTDQQLAFCQNYALTLSGTDAALAAGYSEKTAGNQAAQLLRNPNIRAELQRRMAHRARRLDLKADKIVLELMRVAFSDIRDVSDFGPGGLRIRDSLELHDDSAAAIQSIQTDTKTRTLGRDGGEVTTVTIKIKMHEKLRALDLLARHLGLLKASEPPDEFAKMALPALTALAEKAIENAKDHRRERDGGENAEA